MTTPDGWKRLVVTLRPLEVVRVDGPARFSIAEFIDNRARVAVEAPESTRILRGEASPESSDSGA